MWHWERHNFLDKMSLWLTVFSLLYVQKLSFFVLREMVREETVLSHLHCCCCNLQGLQFVFQIIFLECCAFLGDIFDSVTQNIEMHSNYINFCFLYRLSNAVMKVKIHDGLYKFLFLEEAF